MVTIPSRLGGVWHCFTHKKLGYVLVGSFLNRPPVSTWFGPSTGSSVFRFEQQLRIQWNNNKKTHPVSSVSIHFPSVIWLWGSLGHQYQYISMKNASPVATPRSHGVKRSENERRHPHLSETSWQPPGTGYESEKILVAQWEIFRIQLMEVR